MEDEDFAKDFELQVLQGVTPSSEENSDVPPDDEEDIKNQEDNKSEEKTDDKETSSEDDSTDSEPEDDSKESEPEKKEQKRKNNKEDLSEENNSDKDNSDAETKKEDSSTESTPDYEAAYKKLTAPFKANGKEFQVKSVEEAISLMQKGLDYTRKTQRLKSQEKFIMMLENNKLLNEDKLSYLIDLDKKNPEAIKKLIKDAGIDPVDLDMSTEPAYRVGNHRVSQQTVDLNLTVKELNSLPNGNLTIETVNAWDDASIDMVVKNPSYLPAIYEQQQSKVYDLIVSEIERREILGILPTSTPFLQKYILVGDELAKQAQSEATQQGKKEPIDSKPAIPKKTVTNSEKAKAASSTRTTPKATKETKDTSQLDDEAFLKDFEKRLQSS